MKTARVLAAILLAVAVATVMLGQAPTVPYLRHPRSGVVSASFDKGFDFRSTSGYVTDVSPSSYVLLTDNYPTTRNGVTFGFLGTQVLSGVQVNAPDGCADRLNTNDARIAGICYKVVNGGSVLAFQVDNLPTASCDFHLAMGDASFGNHQNVFLFDGVGGTQFFAINSGGTPTTSTGTSTSANHFLDATRTDLTNVTWPTTEAAVTHTMTNTSLVVMVGSTGDTTSGQSSTISHLRITCH